MSRALRLWQVLQNRLAGGPVAGVFGYVRPDEAALFVDDENRRRGDAVPQQVVYVIGVSDLVVGVGQEGKRRAGGLRHTLRAGHVVHGQRDNLGIALLKGWVAALQIHDLLAAGPSGLPAVKDEHHVRLASIGAESDSRPLGALEREVGGRLLSRRRRWGARRRLSRRAGKRGRAGGLSGGLRSSCLGRRRASRRCKLPREQHKADDG